MDGSIGANVIRSALGDLWLVAVNKLSVTTGLLIEMLVSDKMSMMILL